jgi:tRNA threonylcarbamoyladenosine biosynthesis protein TsaB
MSQPPDSRAHRSRRIPDLARWLLAIDTSSTRAGVSLFDGEHLHEWTWPSERSQTTQVPLRIDQLLRSTGLETSSLAGVAVAIGPGTFTGLRVGLSLAKGLAMAHHVPIVGVPTLAATALPWLRAGRAVIAVLPAGRGRLVWQRFVPGDEEEHPVNGTPAELLVALDGAGVDAVVGELPGALRDTLGGAPAPVLGDAGMASRIGAVASIGYRRLEAGDSDDLAALEPIYVHGTPKATRPVRDATP